MSRDPDWLRPTDAAARYGVSKRTLARWAADREITRSVIGRILFYQSQSIADLIAAHSEPSLVVRVNDTAPVSQDRAWESLDFWRQRRAPR